MKIIQFMKIDWLRGKRINKFLLLGGLLFGLFMGMKNNSMMMILYLFFLAIIQTGQPFALDRVSDAGFVNMLPGTKKQRVAGRFLYGIMLLLIASVEAILCVGICRVMGGNTVGFSSELLLGILGISILTTGAQNTLFYGLGKVKNQQLMVIVQLVPGFLVFFGPQFLLDYIQENPEVGKSVIRWVMENQLLTSCSVILIGVIAFVLGYIVSNYFVEKRDFA